VASPEVERTLRKSRTKWEDEAEKQRMKVLDWIHLVQDREKRKRPSVSMKF